MKVLALGQTLAFSSKSKQYVSCFAGYSYDLDQLIRIFPCEPMLKTGTVYDLDLIKSGSDNRQESYVFSNKVENVKQLETLSTADLLIFLDTYCFQDFDSIFTGGLTLAIVSVASFKYEYGEKYSRLTFEDLELDSFVGKFFLMGLNSRSYPKDWSNISEQAYALIGNKKSNGEWICINLFTRASLAPKFDKVGYQRELMKTRREKQKQN